MKSLEFRPEVVDDLDAAAAFYEGVSPGLGDEFLNQIRIDLKRLENFSGVHSKKLGFQRAHVERFPFAIYYRVRADVVTILPILDLRGRPLTQRRALRKRR
jgi:hypothetical protein